MSAPTPAPPAPRTVSGYQVTRHAALRMTEMGVTAADLATALLDPDQVYPQPPRYGPNGRVFQWRDIAVAVEGTGDGAGRIKTVMWRTQATYTRPGGAR